MRLLSQVLYSGMTNVTLKVNGYLNLLNESVNIPLIGCRNKPLLD